MPSDATRSNAALVPPRPIVPAPGDTYVQSFARGLAVIRSFNAQAPMQTITNVADATGLTRAGARRILLTLEGLGYVANDGRYFSLTAKVLDLGFAYLTSMPLWNLAQPMLETFVQKMQESSSAAVLDGTEIVYVLRVPTKKIMTVNLSVGSRLPAYCSSMGRVLLAALPRAQVDDILASSDLAPRTAHTIVDPSALHTALEAVRRQGWALVDGELESGLISLAAPVRDHHGKVIAAINVSGHTSRTSAAVMLEDFLPELLRAANDISEQLGRI